MYKIPAITLFLGKNLIFVPECHSTNDLALQLFQQKPDIPEGSVIITSHQTAGRGQRGNTWEAEPGKNLTFSIILKPLWLAVHEQFYLNIFIALGICDYLTENTSAKVQIKWPNDILADEKKICGILIENQIVGNCFSGSVVGIGLNINQQQFSTGRATGLTLLSGKVHNLANCFEELLSKLEARYLQFKRGHWDTLKNDYLQSLFRFGETHTFTTPSGTFEGTISGIDAAGRLAVEVNGKIKRFENKEINFF